MPITWPLTLEDIHELEDADMLLVDRLDFEGTILTTMWVLLEVMGTESAALAVDTVEVFGRLISELPKWHPLYERLEAMDDDLSPETGEDPIAEPPSGLKERLEQLSYDFKAYLGKENERWGARHPHLYEIHPLWSEEVMVATLTE
jgi:hypothetical protein